MQTHSRHSQMTARKFFGCHFHSLTIHAPQTFRIFCLHSLIPEQEERSFGDLRLISLRTSSRQCGKIIDNAVLRYNMQQSEQRNSYRKQESIISHQAKLLPSTEDSKFPLKLIQSRPYLFQTHLEQIADFLLLGKNYWWSTVEDNIIFFDGRSSHNRPLPQIQHFRSETMQSHQKEIKLAWNKCLTEFEAKRIQLPHTKIKVFDGNGKTLKIIRNKGKKIPIHIN